MPITLTTSISGSAPIGDVYFGALTLAGAGAVSAPSGATSITDAGGTNLALSSGSVSPATAGVASGTVTFDSGDTWTVVAEASTYSAASNAEASAALNAIGAAGGRTVKLRPGNYTGGRNILTKNRSFTSEVVLAGYSRSGCVFGETWIEGCNYLTIDSVTIAVASGTHLLVYGPCDNITVKNCYIYGTTPIDPEGDYSAAQPVCAAGVATNASGGAPTNLSFLGNELHDVKNGIVSGAPGAGFLRIEGNSIQNYYEDAVKVGRGSTTVSIKDNYIAGGIAASNDFPAGEPGQTGPHSDAIQLLGGGTTDWTGIEIERNILIETHLRSSSQMMHLDDMNTGYYFSGIKIRGNLIACKQPAPVGIRVKQAKNAEIYGNTVVSNMSFATGGPSIRVGESTTSGTHIIKNNVSDVISISGTATTVNNHILGSRGATIPYSTAFSGTGFNPTSRAEALSMFAMKANGPLDVDNSGGASTGDVGAVGSGYVTFPDNPSTIAGTCDATYE